MPDALGGFDPKATFDAASRDYADAATDYWEFLSHRLLDRLDVQPGERVIDVPCGTGASVLDAAQRVGPTGVVVGLDYAEQMVAIAREGVAAQGLTNVELRVGDMTTLSEDPPFDALLCSLGVFFVDDMPGLVRTFRSVARRVGIGVFGEHFVDPMREVFAAIVGEVAPEVEVVQPWSRVVTEASLVSLLEDAGVEDFSIETDNDTFALPSTDDWWRIVMGSSFRRPVDAMTAEQVSEVRARCDAFIAEHGVRELTTRTRYAILH